MMPLGPKRVLPHGLIYRKETSVNQQEHSFQGNKKSTEQDGGGEEEKGQLGALKARLNIALTCTE